MPQVHMLAIAAMQELIDQYHTVAANVETWRGALFLSGDDTPETSEVNHVRRVRLEPGYDGDDLVAEIEERYGHLPYRSVRLDPFTAPTSVEARLLHDGYRASTLVVMVAEGAQVARAGGMVAGFAPLEDDAGWRGLRALLEADVGAGRAADDAWTLMRRRGDVFRTHLALVDDAVVGSISHRAVEGLGYLERLFVHPEHRGHGIGESLVRRAAAETRAGLVFLPTLADGPARVLHARLGFRPLFVLRNYHRDIVPAR